MTRQHKVRKMRAESGDRTRSLQARSLTRQRRAERALKIAGRGF